MADCHHWLQAKLAHKIFVVNEAAPHIAAVRRVVFSRLQPSLSGLIENIFRLILHMLGV